MARNLDDISTFIRYIVRKEKGVYLTYPQITANLDAGQLDCFADWFKPYGVNQEIHDALRPFRVYQPYTSDAAGMVTFPDDYQHLLGQPFTVFGSTVNRVEFLNESELPFALTSQLRAVSNSYPVAVDTSNGFSIYPQSTQTGAYFYLRRPLTPVYGFTQVGRVVTYDQNTSVQLEWSDVYINNIIARSLFYAGINMDEAAVYQFAQQYAKETE
jgi:hypothetical protein